MIKDFTFPIGRARYHCEHNVLGSCELLTYNDPEKDGIAARVFPKDISKGGWYASADLGLSSEAILKWLVDNDMHPMINVIEGRFTIQEYTQLIIMDKKHSWNGCKNTYEMRMKWPVYDTEFTLSFAIETQWYMTFIGHLYPGVQIHKSELEYHLWLESINQSAVEKRRKTLAEAQAMRP